MTADPPPSPPTVDGDGDRGDGTNAGGRIPKTETALAAIEGGVRAAVILDGRAPNACLLELFTEHGAGSIIRAG